MNRDCCILIHTCDKYDHLWEGLRLAYHHNWCWDLGLKIFVITESKAFSDDVRFETLNFGYFGMDNEPSKNFSTRMIAALNHIQSIGYKNVMYTQDDFWPLFPVDINIFRGAIDFLENELADCVYVNEFLPWWDCIVKPTSHYISGIRLRKFENNSPYLYNHQSAFWRISHLLSIQSGMETAHENEILGSHRASLLNPNYYFLNYCWYKAEFINNRGVLLPPAESYVRDWRWKVKWDLEDFYYIYCIK